jgi:UPF0755 protein
MLDTLSQRSERPVRTRRRGTLVLLALIVVLVTLVASGALYWRWATGASGPQSKVSIVIPQGASGTDVANILKAKGVIRSTLAFKLLARFRGFRGGFQAGQYDNLTTNMTLSTVLAALKRGPVAAPSIKVLLPEGYRLSQVAVRAQRRLHIRAGAFTQAATSGAYMVPPYLPAHTPTVEGFLFPDTYQFLAGATADEVITRLLQQFKMEADALDWSHLDSLGVSPYQVVIVASMIEREARYDQDRPKIAAVIYNRLKADMPLEIDATLQYAKGNWLPITEQDKALESPYNTYSNRGLPPTPIASPGLASLKAALSPAHANYLYYIVTDCQGHSSFTASYAEFQRFLANRPSC